MPSKRAPRASSARATRLPDVRVDPNQLALMLEQAVRAANVVPPATVTLAAHWLWWKPRYLPRLARQKEFEYRIAKCLLPMLGELTQDTLTPDAIELCFVEHAKTRAPGTINTIRAAGTTLINDCIRAKRWTAANPFPLVLRRTVPKLSPYIPTVTEARTIIAAAGARLAPRWALLLGLGPRYGEMRGLQVDDWDSKNRRLTIRRSGHRETTKTSQERTIPVPEWLAVYLDQARTDAKGKWLFPGKGGHKQLCRESGRILTGLLRRAGVVTGFRYWCPRKGCGHKEERHALESVRCAPCGRLLRSKGIPRHMRVHDLRHAFCSLAQEAGMATAVVSLVVGHSGANITSGVYTHFRDSYVRAELARLDLTPTSLENDMAAKKRASVCPRRSTTKPQSDVTEVEVSAAASPGPLLTTREVADRLRCDRQTVRRLIQKGDLAGLLYGKDYRIVESSLAELIERAKAAAVRQ